jgi:hypothetical protein
LLNRPGDKPPAPRRGDVPPRTDWPAPIFGFVCGAIMEMTMPFASYVIAIVITVAISFLVMIVLNQPLRRYLLRASNSPERTDFVTRIFQVLLVLMPTVAITMSAGFSRYNVDPSVFFNVLFHLAWSGVGLTMAVVAVAIWAVAVEGNRGGVVSVSPDQVDDLQRLLAKVEQLRAREIVQRESKDKKADTVGSVVEVGP